ncbi:MAG: four helix bundle suffix domain-containing protein [Duncaniella sp.]|nr:four helix bundle suffix domain-containing protein [Duncaniella sp.]
MGVDIKFSQSYFWLNSWVIANIIQLGTQSFCKRFIDYHTDPCQRLYDQMVMAARSGVANIAEGNARHSTSIETQMKLLDVARASIDELQGDLFNYIIGNDAEVWAIGNPYQEAMWKVELDKPNYSNSLHHDAALHILAQKRKYDPWIKNDDPVVVANALLILCIRVNKMLQSQLSNLLEKFKLVGGFTENMTEERLKAREALAAQSGAPSCPLCGKPMLKRMQKKGQGHGREFWGCSDYPNCRGLRPMKA